METASSVVSSEDEAAAAAAAKSQSGLLQLSVANLQQKRGSGDEASAAASAAPEVCDLHEKVGLTVALNFP